MFITSCHSQSSTRNGSILRIARFFARDVIGRGIKEKSGELLETPESLVRYSVAGNGRRECFRSTRIGRSAAEPHGNVRKVQRLGTVRQTGGKPTSPRRESDEIVWAAAKVADERIKSRSITQPIIFNISPTDTPAFSMAKRIKATAVNHQWQTDSLAAAATNRAVEGDDSTYATASPTTLLSNYTQIVKKSVMISGTADAVRKYGRKEEFAYQIAKKGKELKRDIEFAIVQNQGSSAGSTSVARSSAGLESMIAGNRVFAASNNTTGTSAGFASGAWTAPVDGTTAALTETALVSALDAAWTDGGDPSVIMMNSSQKRAVATFGGATKFAGVSVNQGRSAQAVVLGGVDLYISDFGEHKVQLNRYMRTRTVLCLDPEYVSVAFLRPIKFEERAKTGDATRGELLAEWCLVVGNPDAHAKVQDCT